MSSAKLATTTTTATSAANTNECCHIHKLTSCEKDQAAIVACLKSSVAASAAVAAAVVAAAATATATVSSHHKTVHQIGLGELDHDRSDAASLSCQQQQHTKEIEITNGIKLNLNKELILLDNL